LICGYQQGGLPYSEFPAEDAHRREHEPKGQFTGFESTGQGIGLPLQGLSYQGGKHYQKKLVIKYLKSKVCNTNLKSLYWLSSCFWQAFTAHLPVQVGLHWGLAVPLGIRIAPPATGD
jgi:hypothetical protein